MALVMICKKCHLNKYTAFVGANTLIYFALHGKCYSVIQFLLKKFAHNFYEQALSNQFSSALLAIVITIILSVMLILPAMFINKYLPFVIGKAPSKRTDWITYVTRTFFLIGRIENYSHAGHRSHACACEYDCSPFKYTTVITDIPFPGTSPNRRVKLANASHSSPKTVWSKEKWLPTQQNNTSIKVSNAKKGKMRLYRLV